MIFLPFFHIAFSNTFISKVAKSTNNRNGVAVSSAVVGKDGGVLACAVVPLFQRAKIVGAVSAAALRLGLKNGIGGLGQKIERCGEIDFAHVGRGKRWRRVERVGRRDRGGHRRGSLLRVRTCKSLLMKYCAFAKLACSGEGIKVIYT